MRLMVGPPEQREVGRRNRRAALYLSPVTFKNVRSQRCDRYRSEGVCPGDLMIGMRIRRRPIVRLLRQDSGESDGALVEHVVGAFYAQAVDPVGNGYRSDSKCLARYRH